MCTASSLAFFLIRLITLVVATDSRAFTLDAGISYSNEVSSMTLLYQQLFAASWNIPASGSYTPPSVEYNRIALEVQVNTTGGNYDRIGQLFIGDIEIWRTSTAEPANDGTTWTVWKDVSHYYSLFKSPQTFNLLIQNQVSGSLNGVFYVTLVAHFYNEPSLKSNSDELWAIDLDNVPNQIQALAKSQGTSSSWSAPDDTISVSVGPLDRSVNRAVVQIFASGNGEDEFWWDSSHPASTSCGPSRFIDLYVDNMFAGFAAPYPTIFSGGVNPSLWKPMINIHTFDIPSYFIDVTPFLPSLWQGAVSLLLNVTNGIDAEPIPHNWIINYNLLTWSKTGQNNSGKMSSLSISHSDPVGAAVDRSVSISAILSLGGREQSVEWKQHVAFNNTLTKYAANNSHVWQTTQGESSISGAADFRISYNYPFQADLETDKYYRIQQSHNAVANSKFFMYWIDSSISLNSNGSFNGSSSREYMNTPAGTHFAETQNRHLSIIW